jgi:hypothetical protein
MKLCFSVDCEDCGSVGLFDLVKHFLRKFKKKTYHGPELGLTSAATTKEALRLLHNQVNLHRLVNRDYEADWHKQNPIPGDKITIRLPNRYGEDPCFFREGAWT